MILDERKAQILLKLIKLNQPITISELAKEYKVSNRTIRYDLDAIDQYLLELGYPILQRKQSSGIYYNCSKVNLDRLSKSLRKHNNYQYKLSQKERVNVIITLLFQQKGFITIGSIAETLFFSRSTIAKDLKEVESWLNRRNLALISMPNKGVKIDGDEAQIRKAAIEILTEELELDNIFEIFESDYQNELETNISGLVEHYFENIDIKYLIEFIEGIEKELNMLFSYDSFTSLLIHIALTIKRIKMNKDIKMSRNELLYLKSTKVFSIVLKLVKQLEERFKMSFPMDEIGYITIHILGSSITKNINKDIDTLDLENFAAALLIANSLVLEVSKLSNIDFLDDNLLLEGLIQHVRPAIHRFNHNIKCSNPYTNEIKNNYKDLFENVRLGIKTINISNGQKISEDEISFITMHFAASIERKKRFEISKRKDVLIVCGNGLATGMLIKSKIENIFDVNIVNVIGYHQIEETLMSKKVDIIITTMALNDLDIPHIRISPMVFNKDIEELNKYLNYKSSRIDTLSEVIEIISKYCVINDYDSLKSELSILVKNKTTTIYKEKLNPMLNELLIKDTIKLNVEAKDWEDAVRIGGELLEKVGAIEKNYTEEMIEGIKKIGPYIVIAPGIAMPHARPDIGVNKVGMSFITLKSPINFGNVNNDPVKIVVCLCAVDNTSHIEALSEMATLLGNKDFINEVIQSDNVNDVLKYIKK